MDFEKRKEIAENYIHKNYGYVKIFWTGFTAEFVGFEVRSDDDKRITVSVVGETGEDANGYHLMIDKRNFKGSFYSVDYLDIITIKTDATGRVKELSQKAIDDVFEQFDDANLTERRLELHVALQTIIIMLDAEQPEGIEPYCHDFFKHKENFSGIYFVFEEKEEMELLIF